MNYHKVFPINEIIDSFIKATQRTSEMREIR